ncbi:MAG: ABC transporter substrate-binding protein [Chloroflexi bacterium]|nr:ABC transporter substrate-binding protein [Chloroflexota bacterium]
MKTHRSARAGLSARRHWLIACLLLVAALVAASCGSSEAPPTPTAAPGPTATPLPPPTKLKFMAGFKPQADLPFAAAYVAKEKGYFQQQNLDVDISHALQSEHLKLLLAGDIDVTTADAGSVLNRRSDPAVPIRAITLFGQKGQTGFAVLQKSGIQTVKDWEGKTFGYKTTPPPEYLALLKAAGVDRSKIKEVRVGFDPRILSEGQVDILAVFKANEPDVLAKINAPTKVFNPEDIGVATLGLTYIATTDRIAKDPGSIHRFVKATLRGLAFAFQNEEETLDIVLKYAPAEDREHQRFMLRAELKDAKTALTEASGLGFMTDQQWQSLYTEYLDYGAIPKPFDYKTAYDDQFVKGAYQNGKLVWP